MAKKKTTSAVPAKARADAETDSLAGFLLAIRKTRNLTLRAVEEATDGQVSNAYVSQLENNKISRPSPHILHELARVYSVPYETLMEKAGYISSSNSTNPALRGAGGDVRHGRAATFVEANLTAEEEATLLEYLQFLRARRAKSGKT